MKQNLFIIITLLLLTACSTAPTATLTPTSTNTPEPEPTATITPTATPDSNAIADSLELRSQPGYESRTFVIEESYLIDQWNNVPKAVKAEDGSWRKLDYTNSTDAEIMYGAMTPGDIPYIDMKINTSSSGTQSVYSQLIYLGDVSWEPEMFQEQTISMAYLLCGLRDESGGFHVVKFGVDGVIPGSEHALRYFRQDSMMSSPTKNDKDTATAIKDLKPGEIIFIHIVKPHDYPENIMSDPYVVIPRLMSNESQDKLTLTEWEALTQGKWPSGRVVELYQTINLLTLLSRPASWN